MVDDELGEPYFPKFFFLMVYRFRNAVCENEQNITGVQQTKIVADGDLAVIQRRVVLQPGRLTRRVGLIKAGGAMPRQAGVKLFIFRRRVRRVVWGIRSKIK